MRSTRGSRRLPVWPAEESDALQLSGPVAHATTGESERIIGLRGSSHIASHNSRIHGESSRVWLLVFLLLLLCFVLVPRVVHCLLLLCHACLRMIHPCMMQGIQGVLVVCCLCANPPVTTWRWVGRVPRGGKVPKMEFPVRPKICALSQRWVNFRPAGGARGQVAGSLPRRQPGTGTRQVKGRCGHTFPPPGVSWYPIRVTWIRIGH